MTNIHDLVNLIRDSRTIFQAKIIDAEQIRKKELENLKSDYIPNSKTYQVKQAEIEQNFTQAVINARAKLAESVTNEIQSLKEYEIARIGRIDSDVMEKVNALRGITMSKTELQVILDRQGASNYWVQRAVASIAEENGISTAELQLPASIDTKLSVLSQIEEQLNKMINDYDSKANTPEACKARFLYLNDDILNNATDIYNNHLHDISEMDAATRAYYKVRAMSGQMSKAINISNSLRNLKSQDAKNLFLYYLSCDSDISTEAFAVAGIENIMHEWKADGKNERFAEARKIAEGLRTMRNVEEVRERLQQYVDKVSSGTGRENEFLPHELKKINKKNNVIAQAIQEMNDREMLTWDTPKPQTKNSIDTVNS